MGRARMNVMVGIAIAGFFAGGCRHGDEVTLVHGPASISLDGGYAMLELAAGYGFVDRQNMGKAAKLLKSNVPLSSEDVGLVMRGESEPVVLIEHKTFPGKVDLRPDSAWAEGLLPILQAKASLLGATIEGWAVAPRFFHGGTAMVGATKDLYPGGRENGAVIGYLWGRNGYLYTYAEGDPARLESMVAETRALLEATNLAAAERLPPR